MRWLLLKDLRILRRSPGLVALLILYPVVLSVLIGFALSAGPDKPKVAFASLVPPGETAVELGGERIDLARYQDRLFESIDRVPVDCDGKTALQCEQAAIDKVESGEALAAVIVPEDFATRLGGLQTLALSGPPTIKVFYNADDPVKAAYVEDTLRARLSEANLALASRFTDAGLSYLDRVIDGGTIAAPGTGGIEILGLRGAERIVERVRPSVTSAQRAELDRVIRFSRLARENLGISEPLLRSLREPLRVEQVALDGGDTSLSSFAVALAVAVSLMFVTLLLAAGSLALEREENAFARLVRGLVSKTGLLVEKAGLAAVCSLVICLAMLVGLGLFVDLDWGRAPLWVLALAVSALAFGALGVAVGAVTREVRAASLLCVMLSLPLAFLALVPSGSVTPAVYDIARAISAVFPFRPTLDALDAALNDSGGLATALAHLAALALAFGAIARLALRRFV
ncbi:MAG TPA: ABC transporter permease [Thermoleophilaceae bacterium]|nr:ABC transporter permease [Thermoleophilaceae bacterium]